MTEKRQLEPADPRSLKEDRYRMESVLGEGSMGRTYLAHDAETDSKVAVKALYPSRLADWKDLDLFNRESGILQRMEHPQIPAYIDAFHEGEEDAVCYFLVQEWVDGRDLRAVMNSGKRFDEKDVIELGRQILGILEYMQSLDPKVVHRDIKPENIMMRARDDRPTLIDFGAVREVVRLTMGGGSTIIGTYGYMPPEQLMGQAVPATDIYGLGVVLLECLTRETPGDLHGEDVKRLIDTLQASEGLQRILARMCAPMVHDRFQSAAEVREDLERLASGKALIHARALENEIMLRDKEEAARLKRATSPGIHYGYMTLTSIAVVMATVAVVFVVKSLAQSFESGFILAAAVSGVGMLINLGLLGRRYIHDSWHPPEASWVKTEATVLGIERYYGESIIEETYLVEYEFPTRGSTHRERKSVTQDQLNFQVGDTFDIWYPPGHPEYHDAMDIRHEYIDEMNRLFDPKVEHTPE